MPDNQAIDNLCGVPVTTRVGAVLAQRWGKALGGCRTRRWMIAMLALVLVMLGSQPARSRADAAFPEEVVKAIFLYRFAGYVTWPAAMATAPNFTIAVMGAEDVAEQLRQYLPEHPIQGRPARVATVQGVDQLGDAQIVYIGPGFTGNLRVVIDSLKDRSVLIVTDRPGALEEGSTVNFLLEQQHVRFEISTAAAKRSGLQIGSGLLAVAERVKTSDTRGWSLCRPFGAGIVPCPVHFAARISHIRYRGGA